MKNKVLLILVCGLIISMPSILRAEEGYEIELTVVNMTSGLINGGDDPLDEPGTGGSVPPSPTDFRAVRNGNTLSITRQNEDIPFAQAIVVRAATGNIVLNQQFTESLSEQIATSGVYVLRIETDGGALVGQFIVQ